MQQKLPTSSEAQDPVRRVLLQSLGGGALVLAGCASAPSGRPGTPPRLPPSERACADRLGWGLDAAAAQRWQARGRRRMIAGLLRPASGEGLPAPVQARLEAMSIVTMSPLARLQQLEQLRRGDDRLAATRRLDALYREAAERTLLLAIHSPHGVRERMTWFWSNHFSVAAAKSNLRALVGDHEQALRERALGRFEDLLQAATFQPAMLRYLDNESSAAGRLNENHARELLELHTLGVDGGYTQRDVQELARVLSGLGLSLADPGTLPRMKPAQPPQHWRDGLTEFNPARHDDGDKTLLGRRIVGGRGREEIVEALRLLARHPATARHVCTRLALFWLGVPGSAGLIERLGRCFLDEDGAIAPVLALLFADPEFEASLGRRFKEPLLYVVSAARLAGDSAPVLDVAPLLGVLGRLGQRPFGRQTPDGYPCDEASWSGPGQMVARFEAARSLARTFAAPPRPVALLDETGVLLPLGERSRGVLDQVRTPQERNALLLSAPEFMRS
jgi:uncharacterized protein (DUF1800 family)